MNCGARHGQVLCVGRLYCDLIFTGLESLPTAGEERFAAGLSLHAGGGAYITSAWLVSLGRNASLMATLPVEPFASLVKTELLNSGVDDSLCDKADSLSDPQITVAMAQGGDRAFLTRRAGSALPERNFTEALGVLPGLCHVHIGELTTAIEFPHIIKIAREAGMTVSLDCGWDELAMRNKAVADIVQSVDVFLPNRAEVASLKEHGTCLNGHPLCVVKEGAQGASIRGDAGRLRSPACKVEVLDTTGAGDAFNAGFLHSWLLGEPPEQCLVAGNACGATAVSTVGGAAALFTPGAL